MDSDDTRDEAGSRPVSTESGIDAVAGLRDPAYGEPEAPDYEPDPAQAVNPARAIDVVAGLRDPANPIDPADDSSPADE
jgi:hypothetical protein